MHEYESHKANLFLALYAVLGIQNMAIMVSDLKRRPFRRQDKVAVHSGITVFDIITLEHAPVYKFCVVSLKLKPSRPAFFSPS